MSILFGNLSVLAYLLFAGAIFVPIRRIFARAGLNPGWSFLLFVLPIAPPLILAYAFWPALEGQKLVPRIFD